jgi:hypothetical protein
MGARHRLRGCLRASPFLALATLLACSAPPSPSPSPSPSLPAMVGWPALQVVERLDVPMHGDA